MFHIPLQGANGARPGYTDGSFYRALSTLFAYVFLDFDTSTSFALGAAAVRETNALRAILKDVVRELREGPYVLKRITGLFDGDELQDELQDYGKHLIERLSRGGKSVDNVVAAIIPTAAAAVATQAQGVGYFPFVSIYYSPICFLLLIIKNLETAFSINRPISVWRIQVALARHKRACPIRFTRSVWEAQEIRTGRVRRKPWSLTPRSNRDDWLNLTT